MARVYTLPPTPGVKDLNTLMAFLQNKDEYDARLQALTTLEEEINALILKVGPAEEIETLHKQAEQAAKDSLALAQKAAEEVKARKDEAEAQAAEVIAKALDLMKEWQMKSESLAAIQAEFAAYKTEQQGQIDQQLAAISEREAAAAKAMEEAQALQVALQEKLDKLKALAV